MAKRIAVVGGGITGLTTAFELRRLLPDADITLFESDQALGGKIRSTPFAGIDAVDEGADAFLTRVPYAMQLAADIGLADQLTSPATASANVWFNGLHPIPEGLLLGVPSDLRKLARSGLLTWPGKLRAGLEPFLPGTGVGADSVGRLIRKRFGRQVHERLVDPLVGSIYAADTDHFSLAGVPQIFDLASKHRSLLLGARTIRAQATAAAGPIFATPRAGMAALTSTLAARLAASNVTLRTASTVTAIEPNARGGWVVAVTSSGHASADSRANHDSRASQPSQPSQPSHASLDVDAVVVATPAKPTGGLLVAVSPDVATALSRFDHAGVVMATLSVAANDWPRQLHQSSGYLVPKPVQRWVTAASFASTKWAHWRSTDAHGNPTVLLRVSLGRDGRDLTGEADDALLAAAVDEVGGHLGLELQPLEHRLTRWPMAFPQYRPGHAARVADLEGTLQRDAPGIWIVGASYHGIGIPACIAQAQRCAGAVADFLNTVRN